MTDFTLNSQMQTRVLKHSSFNRDPRVIGGDLRRSERRVIAQPEHILPAVPVRAERIRLAWRFRIERKSSHQETFLNRETFPTTTIVNGRSGYHRQPTSSLLAATRRSRHLG